MKKILLTIIALCSVQGVLAQVTIGSAFAPASNAILDLKVNEDGTSRKGLLLPRVRLSTIENPYPLAPHVAGMMVYNLTEGRGLRQGTYYSDGEKWNFMGEVDSSTFTVTASNGLALKLNDVKLGGEITERTQITGITGSNNIIFRGTGQSAMNLFDGLYMDAGDGIYNGRLPRVGLGKGNWAPTETLDVDGTVRIRKMVDIAPFSLLGSTTTGQVGIMRVANALNIDNGILKLGGSLTSPTSITNLTSTNTFSFIGAGESYFSIGNLFTVSTRAVSGSSRKIYVKMGNYGTSVSPEAQETLDIGGTLRVRNVTGSEATTLTGRDSNGTLTNMKLNNGLHIAEGNLRLGGNLSGATTIGNIAETRRFSLEGRGVDAVNLVNTISIDATNQRVGIGENRRAPNATLDVAGEVVITSQSKSSSAQALDVKGNALVSKSLTIGEDIVQGKLEVKGTANISTLATVPPVEVVGQGSDGQITQVKLGNGLHLDNQGHLSFGEENTVVNGSFIANNIRFNGKEPLTVRQDDTTIWVYSSIKKNEKGAHITFPGDLREGTTVTIVYCETPSTLSEIYIRAQRPPTYTDETDVPIMAPNGIKYSFYSDKKLTLKAGETITIQYLGTKNEHSTNPMWIVVKKTSFNE